MEWVEKLRGAIVACDTAPFIYLIEENLRYLPVVEPFFEALDRGEISVVTSSLTLLEVLIHPLRKGQPELANKYRGILLEATGLEIIPVSVKVAEIAAGLRAQLNLRTPDAIQLASALFAGASALVTNDADIRGVEGLTVITLDSVLAV